MLEEVTPLEKYLDENYNWSDLRFLQLDFITMVEEGFGKVTIEELLKNIEKVMETY